MDGDIYTEPQDLEGLEPERPWSELEAAERGNLIVTCATAVKEDTRGWTNQDSLMACMPAVGSSEEADWNSYDDNYGQSEEASSSTLPNLLLGVLDGHGRLGHEVSRIAAQRIPGHFAAVPGSSRYPSKALAQAVVKADHDVYKRLARDVEYNGSTAVVVCLDRSQKVLYCANVGDSRAVVGRLHQDAEGPRWETVPLTTDIKPDLPDEKERIEMSGGVVSAARMGATGEYMGPQRVWEDWSLTKPGLAMGRSIGDGCARRVGIIADPVMSTYKLRSNDRFIIIASDGLWDALSSEEAVALAARYIETPEAAPRALIDETRKRQEGELEDDTTIVMAFFTA